METDTDLFRINGIRERDIDLLLLEEFGSSSSFCTFFLESLKSTKHPPRLKLKKAEVSVIDTDNRESDLIVWFKENDLTWIFLIENKIDAQMQEKQAEDYRKRGKGYVDKGEAIDYITVLFAPKGYIEEHQSQAKKFNDVICYEHILEWISTSDIPTDRKSYKSALLQTAIIKQGERKGDWGVKNPSEAVTKFWNDYWKLVSEIAPEFQMKAPKTTRGYKSSYFTFSKAEGLPDGTELKHKIMNWPGKSEQSDKDHFDLEFKNTSRGELEERYGNKVQEGIKNRTIHCSARFEEAGDSASIRVSLPTLDIKGDLEQQKENCLTAIQRGKELLNFFGDRQCNVVKDLIHPGEFLADELEEIQITATELARRIKVPANCISQIVRGKRDISADTALRLGQFFGTGPELWLNLQKAYDLDQAKAALEQDIGKIQRWQPGIHMVG